MQTDPHSTPETLLTGLVLGEVAPLARRPPLVRRLGSRRNHRRHPHRRDGNRRRAPAPPLCFDFLPDGRLVIPGARETRLLRREPDGSLVTHADLGHLPARGWNEIVVDGHGNAYVNGGGFDLMAGEASSRGSLL